MGASAADAGPSEGRDAPSSVAPPSRLAEGGREGPSADAGFGRPDALALAAGGISLAAHVLLVVLVAFPAPDRRTRPVEEAAIRHVELPPRVEVPDRPEGVARPPAPEVRRVDVEGPLRGAPSPTAAPPPGPAPTPPEVSAVPPDERPALAEADIPPIMEAPEQLRERLRHQYPDELREIRRGGVVELEFFVGAEGDVQRVEVRESSGHPPLDRTARRITGEVTFLPAMIRDRPVGLWVRQRICFVFVDDPDEQPTPEECERRVRVGG